MKNLFLTTIIASGLATAAFAGNPETPAPAPVYVAPVTASVTDWSGLYAGGMYNYAIGGELEYSDGGIFALGGDTYGGFLGYNLQNGSLVYGAEVAYSAGSVFEDENSPIFNFDHFIDAKARVGYVLGNALVYGTGGWTFGTWNEGGFSAPSSGFNAGVGVDYLIGDRFFLGVEYVYRHQTGTWTADPLDTIDADIHSIQARAGFKF